MAILKIRKYPDPVLTKKASPVREISKEDRQLIADMIETMKASEGVGLAANQVGVAKRIFVFCSSVEEKKAGVIVNPALVKRKGRERIEEGCLSLPGISAKVSRYKYVTVEGMDLNGRPVRLDAKDLPARIIQHEMDHLNGVLLLSRVNPLSRLLILRQLKSTSAKSK